MCDALYMSRERYWIFYRTDDGWRTMGLREMPWNERIGLVFAAVALVTLSVLRGLGAI